MVTRAAVSWIGPRVPLGLTGTGPNIKRLKVFRSPSFPSICAALFISSAAVVEALSWCSPLFQACSHRKPSGGARRRSKLRLPSHPVVHVVFAEFNQIKRPKRRVRLPSERRVLFVSQRSVSIPGPSIAFPSTPSGPDPSSPHGPYSSALHGPSPESTDQPPLLVASEHHRRPTTTGHRKPTLSLTANTILVILLMTFSISHLRI
ncbi:hypothetical protein Nepgr_020767 [Nepenthes gracilis]|uniref:Uncharacterized protein n=1 Tax=Nepenthes gracilis TaxID=150966 RepID=A0AAD3SXV7_NEPGR|nr:hypothetical protein Nepgr_020767 [Nepenthes gracilis]